MALEGTLRDFSLADIFQLIGLQKKTGILTLTSNKEEARILFMNGLVVGADTNSQKLENRLGHVLVKSNRITQEELDQVLEVQSQTLQRLGQVLILKGFIKPEDLRESLQTQTTQIIFRLFRWTDGEYHFHQERFVDYDQENFTPITSESILMEGVRMLDEWPMIEKVIPNFDILVERTEEGQKIKLDADRSFSLDVNGVESFDDLLEDVISGGDAPGEKTAGLDGRQEKILKLIQGPCVVQDLIDRSGLNEFETCRILYDLIDKGLVRKVAVGEMEVDLQVIEEKRQIPFWAPACLAALIAVIGFFSSWNPLNRFFPPPTRIDRAESQYAAVVSARLARVATAIDLYYVKNGKLPMVLSQLTRGSVIDERELQDPFGRDFVYEVRLAENAYTLVGMSRDGRRTPDLTRRKGFPSPESADGLQP